MKAMVLATIHLLERNGGGGARAYHAGGDGAVSALPTIDGKARVGNARGRSRTLDNVKASAKGPQ